MNVITYLTILLIAISYSLVPASGCGEEQIDHYGLKLNPNNSSQLLITFYNSQNTVVQSSIIPADVSLEEYLNGIPAWQNMQDTKPETSE